MSTWGCNTKQGNWVVSNTYMKKVYRDTSWGTKEKGGGAGGEIKCNFAMV